MRKVRIRYINTGRYYTTQEDAAKVLVKAGVARYVKTQPKRKKKNSYGFF